MNPEIAGIARQVLQGKRLTLDQARPLTTPDDAGRMDLFYWADRIRRQFCGDRVRLCAIVNAKSGACSEDCAFCTQSTHHQTEVEEHDLLDLPALVQAAREAGAAGAKRFGIVTSGAALDETELRRVAQAVRRIQETTALECCASLGHLTPAQSENLKQAGLERAHHNLETSERFFPQVCTTHTYASRVATVEAIRQAGLHTCCGGIFGLGESWEDRLALALAVRELGTDSVPLNFLYPVPGTRAGQRPRLEPMECLHIIAVFRFLLPDRDISVAGGREACLRDLQSWIFFAGANGLLLGNYLTTTGRPAEQDRQLLRDLHLSESDERPRPRP